MAYRSKRKHNTSFLARESLIFAVTLVIVIGAAELLHRFAANYGLTNLPVLGSVLFDDYPGTIKFCLKIAVILVYVLRPLLIILRWGSKKGAWHRPPR